MVVDQEKRCDVCNSPSVELHHIFPGVGRRSKCDEYGLTVWLCPEHHRGKTGVHMNPNKGYDLALKQYAQKYFEENFGDREKFIQEFGKSYL